MSKKTVTIITLFPEVFEPILNSSILKRAQKKDLVRFNLVNIRDFGEGRHQVVDGRPFGGGVGMVLKADVLGKAVESIQSTLDCKAKVILTSASGTPYKQKLAEQLSDLDHLIIVCGHYEGVDQRFIDKYVDLEISIGDYILTGGEVPAMVVVDSITRLIPRVLEKPEAVKEESFSDSFVLEHPHYTRPNDFEGDLVPEVLRSGDHQKIKEWQKQKSQEKTKKIRPDLLKENPIN